MILPAYHMYVRVRDTSRLLLLNLGVRVPGLIFLPTSLTELDIVLVKIHNTEFKFAQKLRNDSLRIDGSLACD